MNSSIFSDVFLVSLNFFVFFKPSPLPFSTLLLIFLPSIFVLPFLINSCNSFILPLLIRSCISLSFTLVSILLNLGVIFLGGGTTSSTIFGLSFFKNASALILKPFAEIPGKSMPGTNSSAKVFPFVALKYNFLRIGTFLIRKAPNLVWFIAFIKPAAGIASSPEGPPKTNKPAVSKPYPII